MMKAYSDPRCMGTAFAATDDSFWPTGEASEATTQFRVTGVDRIFLLLPHFDVNDRQRHTSRDGFGSGSVGLMIAARPPWWTWIWPASAWVILSMASFLGGGAIAAVAGVTLLGACPSIRVHRFRREFDSVKAAIRSRTFHCGYRSEHR